MSSVIQIFVHASQFPERVRRDLLASLRTCQVNHKFHYDTFRQTQKWLALHEAWSPARTDPNCEAIYDASFRAAAQAMQSPLVTVIGLGCGGGQKDMRLLRLLTRLGRTLVYLPCDVSTAMVLVAANAAKEVVSDRRPLVLDLALADDLAETVADVV